MAKKSISNSFTVNTVEDGESAPYYFQEWFAWSSVATTADVITEPTPNGGWATSIPAQGSYAYLWCKSIRYVWNENTRSYSAETSQYYRKSGTNGTSINVKGNVDYAYQNVSSLPPASSSQGKKALIKEDNSLYSCVLVYPNYQWVQDPSVSVSDGDSYTVGEGNFSGNYQSTDVLGGHLVMWSDEANDWVDLGKFQGANGVTYYTHIAWATEVTLESSELPIPAGQTNRPNALAANISGFSITPLSGVSYAWMGYLIDTNSSDSQVKQNYTWQRNKGEKGDDASEVNPNILLRTIFDDGIDKVSEKWSFDSNYVSIDTASDTVVEGRKSIRLNSQNNVNGVGLSQSVLGKIKPNTWYTASFNVFHTSGGNFVMSFYNLIGGSRHLIYDGNVIVDGVARTIEADSCDVVINGAWDGARHTVTFKTRSSEHISTTRLDFVFWQGYISTGVSPYSQTAICMPKLEIGEVATAYMANEDDLRGEKGDQGDRGKVGRFFYYGGTFDTNDNTPFPINDAQAPYFDYIKDGQKRYAVYNPANNPAGGSLTMSQMTPLSGGLPDLETTGTSWEIMTDDYKYLITEAIFGRFAHFGGAIINGDFMLSQYGTINGVESQTYTSFDADHPNDNTGSNFIPYYCVNMLTGETYQNKAVVRGTVYADSGYFNGSLRTVFHNIANDSGWVYYSSSATRPSDRGVGWNYVVGDYDNMCMLAKKTIPPQYVETANNLHIWLPNLSSMIGRRIIFYEMNQPPFSGGASWFSIRQENGEAFVGVSAGGHELIDFRAVYGVGICAGVAEFLAVPHASDSTKCSWVLTNIDGCLWNYE